MRRRLVVRAGPLQIFLGEVVKLDRRQFLALMRKLVLRDLGLLLGDHLLGSLSGRPDHLFDAFALKGEIDVVIFSRRSAANLSAVSSESSSNLSNKIYDEPLQFFFPLLTLFPHCNPSIAPKLACG